MKKFAHILNPVRIAPPSDLAVAQPVTFASVLRAVESIDPAVGVVDLLSAQYPEDRDYVPEWFRKTPDLDRSILDFGEFRVERKLPLLADVIDRMYEASDAEWLIYTNVDIGVQPRFYEAVGQIIDQGYDAFAVNRRTISDRYSSPTELPEMYAEVGKKHAGFDCFVFHRTLWPKIDVGKIVIGMPKLGKTLLVNLAVHARRFVFFTDLRLTFHIGDTRGHANPRLGDLRSFNQHVFADVWRRLRPGNPGLEPLRPGSLHPTATLRKTIERAGRTLLYTTMPERVVNAVSAAYRRSRQPRQSLHDRYAVDALDERPLQMTNSQKAGLNANILASFGTRFQNEYSQSAEALRRRIARNTSDVESLLGLADTLVLLFVFAYWSRARTIPEAERLVETAAELDPTNSGVSRLQGIMNFLNWKWDDAEAAFEEAIQRDPKNPSARHWYSLYLVAMARFDEAMAQSDAIMELDPNEDYLVGRGSLLYFQHRFEELKELMHRTTARDPEVPWGYDWLGMAYNGLEEHDDALKTYKKAFELSDGTAEVGAGYAHALGLAGETALAQEIAGFYARQARERYVPPVQRAYIHIGLGEHDEAIRLLEQAYDERSWFLIFMKVEPWLDPLREDARFKDLERRMRFPD